MFSYSYDNLKRIVKTEQGQALISDVEKEYKKSFEGKPIYALEYSQFKRFDIDGNRDSFQKQYFERRTRLAFLQILALVNDEYLEDLENILSAICEEFIWILPAHAFEDGVVAKYEHIDLFSAETAFYLAETAYVYGDRLSEDIRNRIYLSVKHKVIDVFEKQKYYFEETHSNWAAVCACGVGLAYLYLFPERFSEIKERIFECMEHYLLGLSEDGYCEEGMSYWQYGFGFFSIFFDVYIQLTGEYPEILKREKVINTLKYPQNARMGKSVYLPFADGGSKNFVAHAEEIYAIKNLFGDDFELIPAKIDFYGCKPLAFRLLYGMEKFGFYQEKTNEFNSIYYKTKEVFIRKEKEFAFAVKCGTNYEMHNHDDVGAFQIVKDGKRLIADLGAGEYTKDYFRNHEVRFGEDVFVCGSMSHSVPIIDGKYQRYWKPYRGKLLSQNQNEIAMDIAGAYQENEEGMLVKYHVDENGVYVDYQCLLNKTVCYRFVSDYSPKLENGRVIIEDMEIICRNGILPTVKQKEYKDAEAVKRIAYIVDYNVEITDEEIGFALVFNK